MLLSELPIYAKVWHLLLYLFWRVCWRVLPTWTTVPTTKTYTYEPRLTYILNRKLETQVSLFSLLLSLGFKNTSTREGLKKNPLFQWDMNQFLNASQSTLLLRVLSHKTLVSVAKKLRMSPYKFKLNLQICPNISKSPWHFLLTSLSP